MEHGTLTAPVRLFDEADTLSIEAFIPEAGGLADMAIPRDIREGKPGTWPDKYKEKWNRVYHASMDTLTVEAGLRSKLSPETERTIMRKGR
ncbi:MAG: hypothetical protein ACR2PH_02035 [Desulfobulbia bacterium]